MKLIYTLLLGAVAASPVAAQVRLPVEIADSVTVEAAWIRPTPDNAMSEVFLVVNNETSGVITLKSVRRVGENDGILISPTGATMETIKIPIHAELYMTEGGVRALVEGRFEAGETAELQIDLNDGTTSTFPADVLAVGAPLPDHHDYPH